MLYVDSDSEENFMTRFLSSLLILLLIVAGLWFFYPRQQSVNVNVAQSENSNQKWLDFSHPQRKFQIKFPSLPHHATETIEDPATHEKRLYDFYLASKDDGTIYAINAITFPENKQYDEEYLRNFVQQMLMSNAQNKIKSLELSPFRKGKALDFKVENAEVTIDGKAFFDDNTLYILSTTARNDHHDAQEFEQFIDSFQLPKGK